jgi:ABC-type molybdate transport system substrate-binding protein
LASRSTGDVFAGADDAAYASLLRRGRIGPPVAVASTRLVLIVPRRGKDVRKVSGLGRRGVSLLIARSSVSFGAGARTVLLRLHLSAVLRRATTTPDTAGQIAARVAASKADAALLYECDLTKAVKRKLRVLAIPAAAHPGVTFAIAVVKTSRYPAPASAYIAKVRSPAGQAALRSGDSGSPELRRASILPHCCWRGFGAARRAARAKVQASWSISNDRQRISTTTRPRGLHISRSICSGVFATASVRPKLRSRAE